ncbi:DUF397 domain-containing protein, partial [Kitasatospora sp. NPDC058263]
MGERVRSAGGGSAAQGGVPGTDSQGSEGASPMNPDLSGASWAKSSYSDNGGQCLEVSADFPGAVPVRDSKDPEGPTLVFPADA